jgi:hypothetical protein
MTGTDGRTRQRIWRQRIKKNPERYAAYLKECATRSKEKKAKMLSEENLLFIEQCVDQKDKKLIDTPVGLIRHCSSDHFAIQLKDDCTVLNMNGNGAYGLVIKKGLYCYKINVDTEDGKGKNGKNEVKFYCVEKLYPNSSDGKQKNKNKTIRLQKACHISFEKNSLNMLSKIKDLRNCTAPYVGMLT